MESQIAANNRKTWVLFGVFFAVVGAIAYAAGVYFGSYSVTVMAMVFAVGYALWSYYASAKLALMLSGAREVDKQAAPELYRVVENLTITRGMPMPKVYLIDDPAPNAFASGRDPEHAVVAATTGLVQMMDKTELEGVMAHELGHVANRDIRVSMIAFALVAVIGILSDFMLRSMRWGGAGRRDNDDNRGGNALVIVGVLAAAILAPIVAKLIQLAISRRREYQADTTGAQTTRYPEGLARALEKIQSYGSSLRIQNTSTAHLFFANPLKSGTFTKLFSTHPPIEDRIAKLRELENKGY
ncbi:M48 family metalloprotease [Candidatus Saccharibacteria bacterium]|nr:M48 family metalloprotease [Candidatus Saccharibacteria bacterium]MCB9821723.1 M48 family metalloprotease [Candidatus Nomurabacteria bacterium]